MSNESMTAHQIMQALATYQRLAQVFALKEQYDRRFWEQQTDDTRLVFETMHEGGFEATNSFSFDSLEGAIAQFQELLASPPQESGWQKPVPYSFETHIHQPQVVGDYWEFREDLKGLIGLNRHFARTRVRPAYHFFMQLVEGEMDERWQPCSFGAEDPFWLHLRFQARQEAQAFIERLNTYVTGWTSISSLFELFEYLDITTPEGELIQEMEAVPNYEGLEDELRGSLSLGVYTRLFDDGLEIHDDVLADGSAFHALEYPFDIRELLFYRDRFKYLSDWYDITDDLGVETAPRNVEHLHAAVRQCFDAKWQDVVELDLVEDEHGSSKALTLQIGLIQEVLVFPFSVAQFKQAVARVQQAQEQPQQQEEQRQGGQG